MKLQLEKKKKEESAPKSILKVSKIASNSGVSSLLTGYDSDDSPSQQATRVSWPADDSKLQTTRVIAEPESKRARFEIEPAIEPIANAVEIAGESARSETAKKEGQVDSEIWNEFEALLNEVPSESEPKNKETESAAEASQPVETMEDSRVDTTEIEQASYEARIAQLRLKAAARRKKKAPMAEMIDTYIPELATLGGSETSNDTLPTPLEILRQKKKVKILAADDDL